MQPLSRRKSISNLSSINLSQSAKNTRATEEKNKKPIVEEPSGAQVVSSNTVIEEPPSQGRTIYYFRDKQISRNHYQFAFDTLKNGDSYTLDYIDRLYSTPQYKRDKNI